VNLRERADASRQRRALIRKLMAEIRSDLKKAASALQDQMEIREISGVGQPKEQEGS